MAGKVVYDTCACGKPKDTRAKQCRECYRAIPTLKYCHKCMRNLPIGMFGTRRGKRTGPRGHCRECEAKDSRRRDLAEKGFEALQKNEMTRTHNEDKFVKNIRRSARVTGFNPEAILEYYRNHSGKCDLCGGYQQVTFYGKRLCIDHDHKTGTFRGLLCTNCNNVLGLMKDNPALLQKAIEYLQKERDPAFLH